ncbi:hypothetical protein [Deinococcus frigens]|uniref:hypothetical protein n=1 Tax=Deinococcus frigens TaxID=249403 RepID=UPI000B0F2C30|nr:hypothetical protein [Deinococcus frigens]
MMPGQPTTPYAETVATFARLFPPNPVKHGRVTGKDPETGRKLVKTLLIAA